VFFVFVLFFVFLRFVFVSPLMQNEIETKTAHEIDKTPFSSSPEQVTPGKPGKLMSVFGKWKAIPPVPASTEIIFVPFKSIIEVIERPPARQGPAPSGSAAPEVIAAPDKDDKDGAGSDVEGDDSSTSSEEGFQAMPDSGDPPAAALLGPF